MEPKYLTDIRSVKTKEMELDIDKFLQLIPDETTMSFNVVEARSNIFEKPIWGLKESTTVDESPSSWSTSNIAVTLTFYKSH